MLPNSPISRTNQRQLLLWAQCPWSVLICFFISQESICLPDIVGFSLLPEILLYLHTHLFIFCLWWMNTELLNWLVHCSAFILSPKICHCVKCIFCWRWLLEHFPFRSITLIPALSWIGCTSIWAACSIQRNVYPTATSSRATKNGNQGRTSCQTCQTHTKRRTKSCCEGTRVLKRKISIKQILPFKGK